MWNELWIRRDISDDNWQSVDSTPQMSLNKMAKHGPAPVSSIKKGIMTHLYDTKFLFAAVNAPKIVWKFNESSGLYEFLRVENKR